MLRSGEKNPHWSLTGVSERGALPPPWTESSDHIRNKKKNLVQRTGQQRTLIHPNPYPKVIFCPSTSLGFSEREQILLHLENNNCSFMHHLKKNLNICSCFLKQCNWISLCGSMQLMCQRLYRFNSCIQFRPKTKSMIYLKCSHFRKTKCGTLQSISPATDMERSKRNGSQVIYRVMCLSLCSLDGKHESRWCGMGSALTVQLLNWFLFSMMVLWCLRTQSWIRSHLLGTCFLFDTCTSTHPSS